MLVMAALQARPRGRAVIPYIEQPHLVVGPFRWSAYWLLVCTAALVGHLLILRRAEKTGLEPSIAGWLSLWMILFGFAGSFLFKFSYRPEYLLNILASVRRPPGIASFGGIFGGLLAGLLYLKWRYPKRAEKLRYMDAVAWAFPSAWIFGRAGCALAHDHPGIRTSSWLGVQYPGGTRYDLGLLEVLFLAPVVVLFFWLGRRPRPPGFFLGLFLILYGLFRLALDTLHVAPVRYFGWTVDQFASAAAMLAGALSLLHARQGRTNAQET